MLFDFAGTVLTNPRGGHFLRPIPTKPLRRAHQDRSPSVGVVLLERCRSRGEPLLFDMGIGEGHSVIWQTHPDFHILSMPKVLLLGYPRAPGRFSEDALVAAADQKRLPQRPRCW